jgi:hypothetical protein
MPARVSIPNDYYKNLDALFVDLRKAFSDEKIAKVLKLL